MMKRREMITLLGGAAAWPLAARAQQDTRVRRIGVLMSLDENDPLENTYLSAFMQALAGLGWTEGRNVRMDLRWGRGDTNRRLPRSWSACNPTSSWQPRLWRPLPSSGRRARSQSSFRA